MAKVQLPAGAQGRRFAEADQRRVGFGRLAGVLVPDRPQTERVQNAGEAWILHRPGVQAYIACVAPISGSEAAPCDHRNKLRIEEPSLPECYGRRLPAINLTVAIDAAEFAGGARRSRCR